MDSKDLVRIQAHELEVSCAMNELRKRGLARDGVVPEAFRPYAELMVKHQCSASATALFIALHTPLEAMDAGLELAQECPRATPVDVVELLGTFGDTGWRSELGALDGSDGESREVVEGFIIELTDRVKGPEPGIAVLEYINQRCAGNGWDLYRLYCEDEADTVFAIEYWYKITYRSGWDFAA